jgi:hypothetical protein
VFYSFFKRGWNQSIKGIPTYNTQEPQEALNLSVTEQCYWALFCTPFLTFFAQFAECNQFRLQIEWDYKNTLEHSSLLRRFSIRATNIPIALLGSVLPRNKLLFGLDLFIFLLHMDEFCRVQPSGIVGAFMETSHMLRWSVIDVRNIWTYTLWAPCPFSCTLHLLSINLCGEGGGVMWEPSRMLLWIKVRISSSKRR